MLSPIICQIFPGSWDLQQETANLEPTNGKSQQGIELGSAVWQQSFEPNPWMTELSESRPP